jgi:hypothetical protein
MMDPTTTVLYTCKPCGLHRVRLIVKARQDEDVVTWMNSVVLQVRDDHDRRTPPGVRADPHPDTLDELLIPAGPDRDRIGGPSIQ